MRKPVKTADPGTPLALMPDDEFAAQYPTVTEYLSTVKYDDGSPRSPSALSLFLEDGMCKLALNDKDCKRSLYVASDTFVGALALMESALAAPNPPWRKWPGKK